MKHIYIIILFLFIGKIGFSELRYNISGIISDANTSEDLVGATIYVVEEKRGSISNEYGFYSVSLAPGTYTFRFSFIGYIPQEYQINIDENMQRNIVLVPDSRELGEIIVSTEARNQNIIGNEMGTVKLTSEAIKSIPVLFGEQDVLKTIQLLPGVSSAGEGSTGFFVRGGQADHNLVLLDDAPVYNPSHLLGFFSVFNSDAIKDVKLYKGGIPSRFGGRASSVLDIRLKEGNAKRFAASGGIGLIASRLTLEGPLDKNGSSFIVSGRRTYADLFLLFSKDEDIRGSKLFFYDLNVKAHKELGDKDRFYLSAYLGRDILGSEDFGFNWGNKVATVRWAHVFSNKLFSNTSLIFNDYNYNTSAESDFSFNLEAGIYGRTLKQHFTWYANGNNTLDFGFETNDYNFKPGSLDYTSNDDQSFTLSVDQQDGMESAFYLSNQQKIGNNLTLGYGLRVSNFMRMGPSTTYDFDEKGNVTDSTHFAKGDFYSKYWYAEPRFNTTYVINENTSIKAGYNRLVQFIHLLQNSTAGTPVDYWIPSSPNVKPQVSDQVSAGVFRNFYKHQYQISFEGYYKYMDNQIDYRTSADLVLNDRVEGELLYGIGEAYGAELLIEKKEGKLTGWVGYTLSRSLKKIDGINKGNWYHAKQDRTHDLSIVATYRLSPRWTVSGNWVYYTGNAVTFPAGKYEIEGQVVNLFTERNGYRMPDYHRLDFGVNWLLRKRENYQSELNFSIYNAYARKNAYSFMFTEDEQNPGQTKTEMVYLFKAIPSISWNFKF